MSRDGRRPAHERPVRVQPTDRAGARHRSPASSVRPHVYYRPTPLGKQVTIVNVEALTADERAHIAEAADRADVAGGTAEGDRLRVLVSPSLGADAVYVEDIGTLPTLLLRPDRSPEHAVVAVTYCVPRMSPLEARRLVDAHFPVDGALFGTAQATAGRRSRARSGPGRARMLVLSALVGVAALVVGVMTIGSDRPSAPGESADVGRSSVEAMSARSAERMAAQPGASPSPQTVDPAAESASAEITPTHEPLAEDTPEDESTPGTTSEEDDSPAETSADSSSDPTTSSDPTSSSEPTTTSDPTTSSDPSESPAATESSDPASDEDESDGPDGPLEAFFGIFD